MLTIIQDYKYWQDAKRATEVARQNLCLEKQKCLVYPCAYHIGEVMFYENFCGSCPGFNVIVAQKKQQAAKQKFLDNFRFWNHR